MATQDHLQHQQPPVLPPPCHPHAVTRLAPELIFHVLSFLHQPDSPAALLPIVTLCKSWARLALEIIYWQPVVRLPRIRAFIHTLKLQDRLQNGQMPLWDPAWCSPAVLSQTPGKSLGIDYRAMIKEPCRIVGTVAPTTQDPIHLWELERLLETAPTFSKTRSDPHIIPPALSPPSSPTSTLTLSHPSSPISLSEQSILSPLSPPASPSKVYLNRREKKSQSGPGTTVLLLDISQPLNETMHEILVKVPGMKLSRLQYKWRLKTSLSQLIESNLSSLRELIFLRPPVSEVEFLAVALLLSRAKHIETIQMEHCQGLSSAVLSQLARSCGKSLRTLDVCQHIAIRPMGDHSYFPVDGPEDWNQSDCENIVDTISNLGQEEELLHSGQACSLWDAAHTGDQESPIGSPVDQLGVSESASPTSIDASTAQGNITDAPTDTGSRMDLALIEVGSNCRNLSRLRLHHVTWLSDESLAAFIPDGRDNRMLEKHVGRCGLREIEIVDSYYESQVTVEGVLELCGPDLEVLVIDRKSCWRKRPRPSGEIPPCRCASCNHRDAKQARISKMSTGDRLIFGLIQQGQGLDLLGPRTGKICRLDTLWLIEHWVSVRLLMEAMKYWQSTLRVVNLRLFKCPIKDLKKALLVSLDHNSRTALEALTLGLPWLDAADPEVVDLVQVVLDHHKGLQSIEINKRNWRRETMDSIHPA